MLFWCSPSRPAASLGVDLTDRPGRPPRNRSPRRCRGKGRKQRITPLTRRTAAVLRAWLSERAGRPGDPLFPTRSGRPLSRDAIEHRPATYDKKSAASCPSLSAKKVTAHTLRHIAAMQLLHAGVDTIVIALWLGHEKVDTTHIYLHADLAIKERALARTTQHPAQPGRYRPPDPVLPTLSRSDYVTSSALLP